MLASRSNRMPHLSRALIALGLAGILSVMVPANADAVTIELKDVAPDRIERQRKFAEGSLPLPDTPDLSKLSARLEAFGSKAGAAMLIRIFKAESELEIWLRKGDAFERFATYPICHWSGTLGPKLKEGDKQTPEGFYTVTRQQLHQGGRHPRSLNLGFPNAFDKSQARNGSYILVHGACSSVGCFAMTNAVIEEIYNLSEASIKEGQEHLPVHVFPFRMTAANLNEHKASPWIDFWLNLKDGYDAFERTRQAPRVSVCNNRYEFAEPPPQEGGAPSPLAACGATAAAIETLEPYYKAASHQPLLWQRVLATLTPSQKQSYAERKNLVAARRPLTKRATETATKGERVQALRAPLQASEAASRPATRISTLKCSLQRPSCRRFVSLAQKSLHTRRLRTAANPS